jgi:hypothetical protein
MLCFSKASQKTLNKFDYFHFQSRGSSGNTPLYGTPLLNVELISDLLIRIRIRGFPCDLGIVTFDTGAALRINLDLWLSCPAFFIVQYCSSIIVLLYNSWILYQFLFFLQLESLENEADNWLRGQQAFRQVPAPIVNPFRGCGSASRFFRSSVPDPNYFILQRNCRFDIPALTKNLSPFGS